MRACQVDPCGGTVIYAQVVSDRVVSAYVTGISGGSALNCSAYGITGTGLGCATAQNCSGSTASTDNTTAGVAVTTATNCVGTAYGPGSGLKAETAVGSQGTSDSGIGLYAKHASTCKGVSTSSTGLVVSTGSSCFGQTDTGFYGAAGDIFTNSFGYATSLTTGNRGLHATLADNGAGLASGVGVDSVTVTAASGQPPPAQWPSPPDSPSAAKLRVVMR